MRTGSLFSGYSGLDLAVNEVFGATTAWHSDIDKGACKILAHRYPDVPNLGDITTVDWSRVEPIDVLTGGSPCQDLSHAGRRAGMSEGTRSNLWVAMREAIAALRPPLVIWENVRGAYSAGADSELETRPGLLGSVRRRDGEPVLRALGRVLGDLSDLGYDAQWHGLRAADVGAPHGRFRIFLVANAADQRHEWAGGAWDGRAGSKDHDRSTVGLLPTPTARDWKNVGDPEKTAGRMAERGQPLGEIVVNTLLPTPRASDGEKGGPNQRGSSGDLMLPAAVHPSRLLPTPSVADGAGGHERRGGARGDELLLNGVAKAMALLPTPRASDGPDPSSHGGTWSTTDNNLHTVARNKQWGDYAAAIARWEAVLDRPAPAPTMTSAKGNPQLSPRFVEWMMGLPDGWVTDVPGITRNEALRALGNGVVPQQCAAALRLMLGQAVAA